MRAAGRSGEAERAARRQGGHPIKISGGPALQSQVVRTGPALPLTGPAFQNLDIYWSGTGQATAQIIPKFQVATRWSG